MKKSKKSLKGFTLIELIIVLAIFGVIMVLVMSFIDPVSKVMGKTSVRERTASYVDNIGEYLEKSMRYASYVRVFDGDFCDRKKADDTDSSLNIVTTEEKAVVQFIDDYFDGAINSDGDPLTGKVHVLKLCNDHTLGTDKEGTIYETVYDFTAGVSVVYQIENPTDHSISYTRRWSDDEEEELRKPVNPDPLPDPAYYTPQATVASDFIHSQISVSGTANLPIINPEHFESYSYYYNIGYCTFDPITPGNLENYTGVDTDTDEYYSELSTVRSGYSSRSFSLCTVAYKHDDKVNNRIVSTKTFIDEASGMETTAQVNLFLSPSYMNMTGTSLINQALLTDPLRAEYFRKARYIGPDVIDITNPGNNKMAGAVKSGEGESTIEPINLTDAIAPISDAFTHYTAVPNVADPSENIYFIYVVPSEINVGV